MTTSPAISGSYEYSDFSTELSWKVNDQLADKEGFRHNVYWVTGDLYRGYWSHNKREVNGDRYEGSYKNDMKEGKGLLFYGDGCSRYEGLWHANVPICGTYIRLEKEHLHELPFLEMENSDTLVEDMISEAISKLEA
eukprot:c16391_g1_i4 orf=122-532(-)